MTYGQVPPPNPAHPLQRSIMLKPPRAEEASSALVGMGSVSATKRYAWTVSGWPSR